MSSTQFDNIYHGLGSSVGKLRVASSGMAWKGSEGEPIVALPADDIKWAQWLRVARQYQLRVGVKDHQKHHFDGFAREDHDKLATLLKNYFSVALETKEITFKGWNWGDTDFQGPDLAFLVGDRVAFELPLPHVANSNIAGRTEVSLEFAGLTTAKSARPQGDEMVEIRFHVPGVQTKLRADGDAASDAGGDDDGEEEISAAQVFHDLIKDKAEIGQVSGDMILSFEEVLILTPRGRYDLDMFPDFLRLRGKTYDYKIVYTSISRLFLLAKDDNHVLFILGLNTPIRQGQTRYSYLVMQFTHEEEITAELNMTDEQLAKYNGVLEKSYEKPTYEVVSAIFKGLTGKKITGVGGFKSTADHPGIKANLKAVQGDLFILDKHLFFVSKQPLLIDFADVRAAVFSRVGGGTGARTFDLRVETRAGPAHTFSSIAKEEYERVEAFLRASKLKVKSESVPDAEMLLQAGLADDDEEDEDGDAEMRSVGSAGPARRGLDDDDDSEDDEDFQASSTDEGSPSEAESSDSGAATASDASGDRDVAKVVKKKKTKKAADGGGGKKKKAGDDGDEDAGAGASKPRPKAKPRAKKADDAMDDEDGMDVDDKPKPKPRPKPKPKAAKKDGDAEEDEPPKKKAKTSAD
ncbi:structure-specific recognition protein-domain-containing protein [Schizophyllum fasciatum]